MRSSTARESAVVVLLAVEAGHSTLAAEVDRARRTIADPRDRALLLEIASGTLRWQAQLDALLARCSSRPIDGLEPAIRAILRTSAYQLEHLTRVPAHAVLNDAVDLTRRFEQPRAAGFVNGVLRRWTRTRAQIVLPARPDADAPLDRQVEYLSVTLSHPAWLVRRWIHRVGFDRAETWCRFNNATPPVALRLATGRGVDDVLALIRSHGVVAEHGRFVDDAIVLPEGGFGALPADVQRDMRVQDEASQLIAHAVAARPGERILDLCAAPGAKTAVIAADQQHGTLVACDYRPSRVRLLRRMIREAQIGAWVVGLDATRALPFPAMFDGVFVDVPCSGLGIVRRDPDLKWSRAEDDLGGFATVQARILAHAADVVAANGRLIYATCSTEPEENEGVVDAFLARDARFALEPFGEPLPHIRTLPTTARGMIQTLPFTHALDGFFAAQLRRV